MKGAKSSKPERDYDRHLGLWTALSHFLPADHVFELAQTIVSQASGGALTIGDITDNHVSAGPTLLRTWITRPKSVEGELPRVLQDIVRILAWQNDNELHYREDVLPRSAAAILGEVSAALELGLADLGSIGNFERNGQQVVAGLVPLVGAIKAVAGAPDNGEAPKDKVAAHIEALPGILRAIVLKHLGDLCADQDRVASARVLYELGRAQALACDGQAWRELASAVEDMAVQSLGETARILESSAAAAELLEAALAKGPLDPDQLRTINVPLDLLNARLKADEIHFPLLDRRPSVLTAPQLASSHGLGSALEQWLSGKQRDANRRFWSALRRRMAVGSSVLTREAMTYYGRALLDELNTQVVGRRDHDTFLLGVTLLMIGGRAQLIGKEAGAPALVAAYLDEGVVEKAVQLAARYPGTYNERHLVLVHLLEAWLLALPAGQDGLACALLGQLAAIAKDEAWSIMSDRDLGRSAFKALEVVGKQRPELRRLVSAPVAEAVVQRVGQNQHLLTMAALELAVRFIESFEPSDLTAILELTLKLLERLNPGNADWSLINPGMAIIASDAARALWTDNKVLGRRSAKIIVRFSLDTTSRAASLLALLDEVEPFLAKSALHDPRFSELIATLRSRTGQTSNSGVINDIVALLAAPKLSGREGIEDAIRWLIAVLASAERKRPSIALTHGYDPLIYLTQQLDRIQEDLDFDESELKALVAPLQVALVQFWRDAAERPQIFIPFSIPPTTEPNETVIHNWAFATLGFGRATGAYDTLSAAVTAAATTPALRAGIDLARASRLSARDSEAFDLAAIQFEGRDAFYTALGSRLARLALETDIDSPGIVDVLMRQCLQLGPNGMDAAVLSRALELGMKLDPRDTIVAGYQQRLSRLPDLRRGLLPLLSPLTNTAR